MKKALLGIILFSCFQLGTIPYSMATELQGTVTAKKNGALQVSFPANNSSGPQKGDDVAFSLEMQGIEINAGTGKVSEVGQGFVWVDHLTGNANLNHHAVIQATGKPFRTKPPTKPSPKTHPKRTVVKEDTGWGDGGYQQISQEEIYISGINAAYQACNYQRALQLGKQARDQIPNNAWLQQNYATLEILARRSVNYQKALNGAYQALEQGKVGDSIGLLKKAMQNASVQCGQDQQVLSLLEQAKQIARMEREEAIERARQRSIASGHDSESYRLEIAKKKAEREAFGDVLTGNLLGLLGAFSSADTSNYPKTEPHSDQEMVQKLVQDSEQNNSEILNKWRKSQGWSTTPATPVDKPANTSTPPQVSDTNMVQELLEKTDQNNNETLIKWRKSQGWE